MRTQWQDYRYRIREELKDLEDNPQLLRWQDSELQRYANDGFADYSTYFPLVRRDDIGTYTEYHYSNEGVVLQTRNIYPDIPEYSLPREILTPADGNIISIWVKGKAYKPFRPKPGYSQIPPNCYYVRGDTLVIGQKPGNNPIIIEYHGIHNTVRKDDDELSIPKGDEGLLMWYITARALMRDSGADALLSRWSEKQEKGVHRYDNPLRYEAVERMRQYERGIKVRLRPKHKRMYRYRRPR